MTTKLTRLSPALPRANTEAAIIVSPEFFTRHIARFSDNPEDPAVLREIWRIAESNMIEMLTSCHAYLAIKSLGVELQDAKEMAGESVHQNLEPYIAFGSKPTTTE